MRRVGIHAYWETYPPGLEPSGDLLVIEHVNGDDSVDCLVITRTDAEQLRDWLNRELE